MIAVDLRYILSLQNMKYPGFANQKTLPPLRGGARLTLHKKFPKGVGLMDAKIRDAP